MTKAVLAAALLVVLTCSACGERRKPELLVVPGHPGHLIEINGYRLYFECLGAGKPTVILEAGYGGDHQSWDAVEPELARTTRVCSYDRAGLGLSAAEIPRRRGPFDQEDDLDDLLDGAGIDPPYVIVGHSYGGILAWLFARRHRDNVAGVVLLDSAHPKQVERFRAVLPPGLSAAPSKVSPENVVFARAARDAGELGSIGDTRLVVITAGQEDLGGAPARLAERLRRVWRSLQDDYARRSSDSIHVLARYSGHFIQSNLGQPDLVVRAIREVVAAARANRPLRACRPLFRPPPALCLSG
jgi:pimeloyl-ACP methyl ester carboxylesterase